MPEVRTRFAPSPTGYLHIGGARTALFNYLYARHFGGKFILRIEDTDRERSTPEAIDAILESLQWLGLEWDEGPFFQTQRGELYQVNIKKLLSQGDAYPCICTTEILKAKRDEAMKAKRKPAYDGTCRPKDRSQVGLPEGQPFTIRFRSPATGRTVVNDLVKGPVVFENSELDDLIIARSDGTPTYNFVVVCDDSDMNVTQIIRGDDHLSNTPRQILLYQALGFEPPAFAHVPLILGLDKKRLSKRHGATSVMAYQEMGYLADAVNNYLVRLGWSHGDEEIFDRKALIEKFSIESVGTAAGVFNPEKLIWLNTHYLKSLPLSELTDEVTPFIATKGLTVPSDKQWLEKMLVTLRERAKTLVELVDMAGFYLNEEITIDDKAGDKHLIPETKNIIQETSVRLGNLADFNHKGIEKVFQDMVDERGIGLGKIAQPVRVAITGSTVSPGIYEIINVLGKEVTVKRLQRAIAYIDSRLDSKV